MADINNITVSGRLGKEPKGVEFQSGGQKATFFIAVNRWDSLNNKEVADWFHIEAVGCKAKYILGYANQGDFITLSGQLRTKEYVDEETLVKRVFTYINLQECKIFPKTAK